MSGKGYTAAEAHFYRFGVLGSFVVYPLFMGLFLLILLLPLSILAGITVQYLLKRQLIWIQVLAGVASLLILHVWLGLEVMSYVIPLTGVYVLFFGLIGLVKGKPALRRIHILCIIAACLIVFAPLVGYFGIQLYA